MCKAGRRDGLFHADLMAPKVPKALCFASAPTYTVMLMRLVTLLAAWEADKRVNLWVFEGKPSIQFVAANGIQECKNCAQGVRRARLWTSLAKHSSRPLPSVSLPSAGLTYPGSQAPSYGRPNYNPKGSEHLPHFFNSISAKSFLRPNELFMPLTLAVIPSHGNNPACLRTDP